MPVYTCSHSVHFIYTTQCIDPYVFDTLSGECSLDTDGDTIPDYRARTISLYIIFCSNIIVYINELFLLISCCRILVQIDMDQMTVMVAVSAIIYNFCTFVWNIITVI